MTAIAIFLVFLEAYMHYLWEKWRKEIEEDLSCNEFKNQ